MTSYNPLFDPERDGPVIAPPLERAIEKGRRVRDEKAAANIHDRDEMIRAAVGLYYVLADLLAAFDAERGEQP
ncbi:hypothetical protein [Streptomyces sp. B21-101]|uniref:hypothetical protein n=1 Tax=Streptomyces sp. B21-101 TaxID=3039415 RepID=UPI002FF254C0